MDIWISVYLYFLIDVSPLTSGGNHCHIVTVCISAMNLSDLTVFLYHVYFSGILAKIEEI